MTTSCIKNVLEMLTAEQIGVAFAAAGYGEMTPATARFVKPLRDGQSNDETATQYVYKCRWIDEHDESEGEAYVRIVNGIVVAEC